MASAPGEPAPAGAALGPAPAAGPSEEDAPYTLVDYEAQQARCRWGRAGNEAARQASPRSSAGSEGLPSKSPHLSSKLKASTRKLAHRLGIGRHRSHHDRGGGDEPAAAPATPGPPTSLAAISPGEGAMSAISSLNSSTASQIGGGIAGGGGGAAALADTAASAPGAAPFQPAALRVSRPVHTQSPQPSSPPSSPVTEESVAAARERLARMRQAIQQRMGEAPHGGRAREEEREEAGLTATEPRLRLYQQPVTAAGEDAERMAAAVLAPRGPAVTAAQHRQGQQQQGQQQHAATAVAPIGVQARTVSAERLGAPAERGARPAPAAGAVEGPPAPAEPTRAGGGGAGGPAAAAEGLAPKLSVGPFGAAQDESVFSPRDATYYELRDRELPQALEVLPPGPRATLVAATPEEFALAPAAAGAAPALLPAGEPPSPAPFLDPTMLASAATGSLPREERSPATPDRRPLPLAPVASPGSSSGTAPCTEPQQHPAGEQGTAARAQQQLQHEARAEAAAGHVDERAGVIVPAGGGASQALPPAPAPAPVAAKAPEWEREVWVERKAAAQEAAAGAKEEEDLERSDGRPMPQPTPEGRQLDALAEAAGAAPAEAAPGAAGANAGLAGPAPYREPAVALAAEEGPAQEEFAVERSGPAVTSASPGAWQLAPTAAPAEQAPGRAGEQPERGTAPHEPAPPAQEQPGLLASPAATEVPAAATGEEAWAPGVVEAQERLQEPAPELQESEQEPHARRFLEKRREERAAEGVVTAQPQSLKEALEHGPGVEASLAAEQEAAGTEGPSLLEPPSHLPLSAAAGGGSGDVAVTPADQRSLHAAVQCSDVAASLAAEQEDLAGAAAAATGAGAMPDTPAPLAHVHVRKAAVTSDAEAAALLLPGAAASAAAAEGGEPISPGAAAQPESMDAPAAYLRRAQDLRHVSQDAAAQEPAVQGPAAGPAEEQARRGQAGAAERTGGQLGTMTGAAAGERGGGAADTSDVLQTAPSTGGLREPPPTPSSPGARSPDRGAGARSPEAGGAPAEGEGSSSLQPAQPAEPVLTEGQEEEGGGEDMEGEEEEGEEHRLPPYIKLESGIQEEGGRRLGTWQRPDVLARALDWAWAHPLWALGLAVPLVAALPLLSWAAGLVFGELMPAVVVSGMLTVLTSLLSWIVGRGMGGGPPPLPVAESEMDLLAEQTEQEVEAGAGDAAHAEEAGTQDSAQGGSGPLPQPAEPVSEASTEDLRQGSWQEAPEGGGGLLQGAKDTISGVVESAMEALEPGREQVGEVVQETDSGGEEVVPGTEGPVGRVAHAAAGMAQAVGHAVEHVVEAAVHAVGGASEAVADTVAAEAGGTAGMLPPEAVPPEEGRAGPCEGHSPEEQEQEQEQGLGRASVEVVKSVGSLAERAVDWLAHRLPQEVPGGDIDTTGAAVKDLKQAAIEVAQEAAGEPGRGAPVPAGPALPHAAPKPSSSESTRVPLSSIAPHAFGAHSSGEVAAGASRPAAHHQPHAHARHRAAEGTEGECGSGYTSDSDQPGPVLKGVHRQHGDEGAQLAAMSEEAGGEHRGGAGGSGGAGRTAAGDRSAAVDVARAAACHRPAEEEGAKEAGQHEGSGGMLWRASELAADVAASARQHIKHGIELATGTAEEQRPPPERLADLGESIAQMESERAAGVKREEERLGS
eukprot:scaffold16.g75.t1